MYIVREGTKKKQKKYFTTVVNHLQKWRTPPPPISLHFSHFQNLKIDVFLQLLRQFSNFLVGQKFVTVEFSIRSEIRWGRIQIWILRRAPTSSHAKQYQHTSLSHYFVWIFWRLDKCMSMRLLLASTRFLPKLPL